MASRNFPISRGFHNPFSLVAGAAIAGATLAVLGATVGVASARVIYQDNFDRGGVLNGSTPTIDTGGIGGTANATWSALLFGSDSPDPGWVTSTDNGGQLTYSGATNGAHELAMLPFSPQAGHVYQLQVTAKVNDFGASSNDWMGLQYLNVSDGAYGATGPAMIYRVYGGGTGFPNGIGGSGSVEGPPGGGSTTDVSDQVALTEVLNTTGTVWTAAFSWKDLTNSSLSVTTSPVDVSMSPTGDTSVNMVGLGFVPPIGGTMTSFSLTTVPEPSSLSLLVGAIALGFWIRRRRSSQSLTTAAPR